MVAVSEISQLPEGPHQCFGRSCQLEARKGSGEGTGALRRNRLQMPQVPAQLKQTAEHLMAPRNPSPVSQTSSSLPGKAHRLGITGHESNAPECSTVSSTASVDKSQSPVTTRSKVPVHQIKS